MNSPFNVAKKLSTFKWWTILIIGLLLIILLMILFPQEHFVNRLIENQVPSEISRSYLRNLIQQNPTNLAMKYSLAEQELGLGDVHAAEAVIHPYITFNPSTEISWKILALYYRILRSEAFALHKKSLKRRSKEAEMIKLLPILAQSESLSVIEEPMLAKDALAFEQPTLAVLFYKQAILRPIKRPATFYAAAGKASLFIQDYQDSAHFFGLAMQESTMLSKKRYYFRKAIRSLKYAGDVNKALDFAVEHIDGLKDDQQTLMLLTQLAIEAGRHQLANDTLQQLLHLRYIQ